MIARSDRWLRDKIVLRYLEPTKPLISKVLRLPPAQPRAPCLPHGDPLLILTFFSLRGWHLVLPNSMLVSAHQSEPGLRSWYGYASGRVDTSALRHVLLPTQVGQHALFEQPFLVCSTPSPCWLSPASATDGSFKFTFNIRLVNRSLCQPLRVSETRLPRTQGAKMSPSAFPTVSFLTALVISCVCVLHLVGEYHT